MLIKSDRCTMGVRVSEVVLVSVQNWGEGRTEYRYSLDVMFKGGEREVIGWWHSLDEAKAVRSEVAEKMWEG